MNRLSVLGVVVGLVAAASSVAAQQRQPPQPAIETCSLDDPIACSSCRALAATTAKLEGKDLSTGKEMEGAIWTPLFTAYFMNCPDVGRSLVKRGADVNAGGRSGALLADIATQRAMNPDPKNSAINTTWAAIVEGSPIDVDAPQSAGVSNRQAWASAASASRQPYPEIWARFERKTVPTPLPQDGEQFEADRPTSATGRTRPAESAVSKGVEKFTKIFPRSGTAGLSVEIAACYKWALQIAKPAGRRLALEHCAALDIVSRGYHLAFTSRLGLPPIEFFETSKFEGRINLIRDQAFEGLVWPVYRRNLESSAADWFGFHYEVMSSRDAATSPR